MVLVHYCLIPGLASCLLYTSIVCFIVVCSTVCSCLSDCCLVSVSLPSSQCLLTGSCLTVVLYDWLCLTVVWFLWCPIPYVLVVVRCSPDLVCYADDPTSCVRLVWFWPHCCMSGLRDVNSICDVLFHVCCLIPCVLSDSMCDVRFHVCQLSDYGMIIWCFISDVLVSILPVYCIVLLL